MSSRSSTPGGFPKIPPIITSNLDRAFLIEVNEYIEHELDKVDSRDPEQRYIIYRNVFNKVTNYNNMKGDFY